MINDLSQRAFFSRCHAGLGGTLVTRELLGTCTDTCIWLTSTIQPAVNFFSIPSRHSEKRSLVHSPARSQAKSLHAWGTVARILTDECGEGFHSQCYQQAPLPVLLRLYRSSCLPLVKENRYHIWPYMYEYVWINSKQSPVRYKAHRHPSIIHVYLLICRCRRVAICVVPTLLAWAAGESCDRAQVSCACSYFAP